VLQKYRRKGKLCGTKEEVRIEGSETESTKRKGRKEGYCSIIILMHIKSLSVAN
jgi:hypothetical protein